MHYRGLLACMLLGLLACESAPEAPVNDQQYVEVTLALLRARSTPIEGPDSTNVQPRLDSIYEAYGITAAEYQAMTLALASEPERALRLHTIIKDSLGIRR
jgi:hypothetical protein